MTVSTENSYAERAWTGVETTFTPGFSALHRAHVRVYDRNPANNQITELTLDVHFAVTIGVGNAVEVTPIALPPAPRTLLILRNTPALQETNFQNLGSFGPGVHTNLHDAAAMRDSEERFHRDRALQAPLGETLDELAPAVNRAGRYAKFNDAGQVVPGGLAADLEGGAVAGAEHAAAAQYARNATAGFAALAQSVMRQVREAIGQVVSYANQAAGFARLAQEAARRIQETGGVVTGPASSIDGRIALFDGTGGDKIKQHSEGPPGDMVTFNAADQGTAEGGLSNATGMTPLRTEQAINAARNLNRSVHMINGTIVSVATGTSISFAVKTHSGADPSASSPVYFVFRGLSLTQGGYLVRKVTSALSITVSNGSTLGAVSGVPFKVWLLAIDPNTGGVELAVINCLSGTNIYPLGQLPFFSTTAEGGAGGADSAHVPYSATARASVPYAILGYASWESGLGAAGTWNSDATRHELFSANTPLPGMEIQRQGTVTGAVATGSTALPLDDTIPQNTEGDEYLSRAITPTSAANVLRIYARLHLTHSAATTMTAALFQDSIANALAAGRENLVAAQNVSQVDIDHEMVAGASVPITFKARAGAATGATTTFNGASGTRQLGGVLNSYLRVDEVMA